MSPQEALLRQNALGKEAGPEQTSSSARMPPSAPSPALEKVEARMAAILAEFRALPDGALAAPRSLVHRFKLSMGPQWFMAVDLLALAAGFLLAWGLAALLNFMAYNRPFSDWSWIYVRPRLLQFMGVAAAVVLWFENTGHYRLRQPFWIEMQNIFSCLGMALLADVFLLFAMKQDTSRSGMIFAWIFAGALVIAGRHFLRHILRRRGLWQIKTLLVGTGPLAEETRTVLQDESNLGYDVTAQIEDPGEALKTSNGSWQRFCLHHRIAHVIIALEGGALDKAKDAIARLMREDIPFSVVPAMGAMPVLNMAPRYFFNRDLTLMTRTSGLDQPLPRLIKRTMDFGLASIALLLASPAFLLIALLVKSDGGPAFFHQPRVGMNGKMFACLKFRSMKTNSKEIFDHLMATDEKARREFEQFHKLKDDPRVTRVGAFLRATSMDELPQIINVLMGDMSLVGPRPIVTKEIECRGADLAYYLRVRPGLTGLWQVSGRSEVSFDRRVQMESWYVRNWSLWNDIAIMFKTFPVILGRKGAY